MRRLNNNESEMERLAEEIRSQGMPYEHSQPDERYWANFRVRVMQRITENEERKAARWTTIALDWIQDHILTASLSTAAVLFTISLVLMLQPFGTSESSRPKIVSPELAVQSPAIPPPAEAAPDVITNESQEAHAPHHPRMTRKQPQEMASLDVTAENQIDAADAIAPVSLEELSDPELESVLQSLQSEK
ncbi:MAG: hypothetical protein Q8922_03150 [Bacteroidota bacterium]|nr:hypothetical protein [Bacteroidota bacterium]MDP4232963.1 hypothetical protein [Bacteroidota bacterium]MDP4242007.1 hypothetical protein [Bacteroidota bacterium]MDP4286910.1 hypothetical protein [Bacteroidota bacterium]